MKVTGKFEVSMKPSDSYVPSGNGLDMGRLSLDKTFEGDLEATSKGEMLSAMTATKGSAGYVAMERVSGTLSGKQGDFVLMHFGVMDKGANRLTLEVVPDSGTEDLTGLSGTMQINIENGQHYYEFDYELE